MSKIEITDLSHDELKELYYLLEKISISFGDLAAIYGRQYDRNNVDLFNGLANDCEHIREYLDGSLFEGEDDE